MVDQVTERKSSVCAAQQGTAADTISYLSTSQLDVEKTTSSSKKQPRNNFSSNRQRHRRNDREGGASSQLTASPKQESTSSSFKGGSFNTPPDWLLLGLDQPTDVHLLPPSLKPFPSHSPDIISPLSSPHNSGPGLVGDVGMNLIQQSQEEERGDYARGRHEIVLGNATITVYYVESPSHNT